MRDSKLKLNPGRTESHEFGGSWVLELGNMPVLGEVVLHPAALVRPAMLPHLTQATATCHTPGTIDDAQCGAGEALTLLKVGLQVAELYVSMDCA